MTPEDKKRDKYYRKTYGVGLDTYNKLFEIQGGKCAVCGRPPKDKNLNLDHYHFTIEVVRGIASKWLARAVFPSGVTGWRGEKTKLEAIRLAKQDALPKSIRGLLCPGRYAGCNRKLGRLDNIEWLEAAIQYLKNPPANQLDKSSKL